MPTRTFTCTTCGDAFALPAATLDKYPGWEPRQCRGCRATSNGGGGSRSRARSRRSAPVEENLTLAEVLERYTDGPQDGVFTDGSAHPNPGPGGWGAVFVRNGQVVDQVHGAEDNTTNNRMELTALIAAYDLVPEGEPTSVYTDSRLCVDTITKWAAGWKRNGWRRKSGDVQNLDLVKRLYALAEARPEVQLKWIKAHDGSRWNEYADSLSTAYRREEL